jgi:serine/threonine protein kinase
MNVFINKKIKKSKAIKKIFDRELYAVNEMRMRGDDLMSKLKHDHIAEYYGYFFDDQNHLCLIMKFYQSGNLEDHLKEKKEQNVQLDYMIILKWSLQLLDAIHYTTSRHIIHNDLKPA